MNANTADQTATASPHRDPQGPRAEHQREARAGGGLSLSLLGVVGSIPLQFSGGFLQYALLFFVLAVVAGLVGFRGIAGISMTVAKLFVVVFLVLAVVSLVL